MKLPFLRAITASFPVALLAGTALAAGASPTADQSESRPFAATPQVLGGGATLPVPAYLGKSVGAGFESSGSTSFGAAGSVFGAFASVSIGLNVEYCATGSGKGKGVFAGVANTVDTPCSNAAGGSTATTFGFLPPSGSPRQTFPTLTGTDAPLLQTDYDSYIAAHTSPLEPVELPSIFGSIAIVYRDNALSSSARRLALTDAQICGLYNGSIRTFGTLLGNSDATTIRPIYRLDGSGTSFNFSNHLATVCSGFNGNQKFTIADPRLPSSAIGATGNAGVLSTVIATNGAIGYAETGYLPNLPSLTGALNYANVRNGRSGAVLDPFAGLPASVNSISPALQTNVAVVQGTGPATTTPLTGVRSGRCVKVIPPSAYANPSTGYPIIAVTYLLLNSNGNGSLAANALRLLERGLTTPAYFKHPGATTPITTVDEAAPSVTSGTTGYSSLGAGFAADIQKTANVCINA